MWKRRVDSLVPNYSHRKAKQGEGHYHVLRVGRRSLHNEPSDTAFVKSAKYCIEEKSDTMLSSFGGSLIPSHVALYTLVPHLGILPRPKSSPCTGFHLRQQHRAHTTFGSRRRSRRSSASAGPRLLHPNGSGPEGVPSSLFKFQPRVTHKDHPQQQESPSADGNGGGNDGDGTATSGHGSGGTLDAGLIEEADLPDVSALLVEVRSESSLASVRRLTTRA